MSTLFGVLLVLHVLFGIFGVICSFMFSFMLIKETWERRKLVVVSACAWVAYMVSWIAGGWYYWKHYGAQVKPVIMGGDYSWAHLIFTESKEHVFLFLPFVSFCLFALVYFTSDALRVDPALKRNTLMLSLAVTALGVIVTLSGVLITGGAR